MIALLALVWNRFKALCAWFWNRFLQVFDLLILARIPILMVAAGFMLAGYVPQIRELFDISLGGDGSGWWAPSAFVFTAGLGLLVWFSARTLCAFDLPPRSTGPPQQAFAGAAVPLNHGGGLSAHEVATTWTHHASGATSATYR